MDVMFHENAFDSLVPDWFRDLKTEIRWFFKNIKRIFEYLPVVWNDRDWDEHYIYKILKYKIERTRRENLRGNHLHKNRYAKQMRTCEILLDRLAKDNYFDKLNEKHEKKWGELKVDFLPVNPDSGYGQIDLSHPNAKTAEQKEQQSKEFKRIMKQENMLRKQDLDLFAKIFARNSRNWWS